jgi:hypothetical protein
MRFKSILILAAFLLLAAAPAHSQQDPLRIFDGIWVSVNPPGPHVTFNKVGGGVREASLPTIGQATIRVSDGQSGSNLRVSGEGFDCFYFFGQIDPREMTWEFKSGSAVCPPSWHLKKDPP